MDSKSIGLCPQGLESPRCRFLLGVENASLPIVTSRAQAHLGRRGLMRAHPNTADVEPRAAASPPDLKASMPGRPARELDWPMSMLRKGPGRGKNPSYKDTLAERLGRRPAKPMGSPRVGSNPHNVVFCHCRFVCLHGLHVCLAVLPRCRTLFSCAQEETMLPCLQHASQTPASHSQRHAGMPTGHGAAGKGGWTCTSAG
jgi:hypothetical protein